LLSCHKVTKNIKSVYLLLPPILPDLDGDLEFDLDADELFDVDGFAEEEDPFDLPDDVVVVGRVDALLRL
jgi:hypothetical protein